MTDERLREATNEPTERIYIPLSPEGEAERQRIEDWMNEQCPGPEPTGVLVTVQQPTRWDEVRFEDDGEVSE